MRAVLLSLLGIVVVVLAGFAIALWFGGGPVLAWTLQNPVSWFSGRQIVINGPAQLVWNGDDGWSHLVIEDMHVPNASWGTDPEIFAAKRLEVDFSAKSLVFGAAQIALVQIDDGKIYLETSKDGDGNWQFAAAKSTVPEKREHFPDLMKFVANRSSFTFHNGESGANAQLDINDFALDAPTPDSPVKFHGSGKFQKQPLRVAATVGPFAHLRDTAEPYPVTLDGRFGQVNIVIDGTMKEPLKFDGLNLRVSMAGKRLEDLAEALGVPLPALPDFKGTSVLVGGNQDYTLTKLVLKLADSDLQGGIEIDARGKLLHLTANLVSSHLDMANFKGLYGGNPQGAAPKHAEVDNSGKVIPNTRIEIEKLPGLNVDLSFDGAEIANLDGMQLQRVTLGLHVKDGQLTLKPLKFHAAQGDVALNAVYSPNGGRAPQLKGDIDIQHVELSQLLNSPNLPEMVRNTGGTLGGKMTIDSTGVSPRELLSHMNGTLGVAIQNGKMSDMLQQLVNLNLLKALGVYITGDEPVAINCAAMGFDVTNGVAKANAFLIDTDQSQITGEGTVNFSNETVDLTLNPRNKHFTAITLNSPIHLAGPFTKFDYNIESSFAGSRLGQVEALAIVPPVALVRMFDTGLGENNACDRAFGKKDAPQPNPQQSKAPQKAAPINPTPAR